MSNIAWGRLLFWSTAIIGTGYVCLKTTVPTTDQLYSQLSPDLKRKADEIRIARQKNELQRQIEQASQNGSTGPVWASPPGK
ncbi:hypothetical protein CALCODRAFT_499620 [Calocera cornea HHB12733]|uniref:Cytochrome b mRNA-processing protein 4 n=1 Tax=Calocera cornea HHB12733 TaxID=1353952 RepID=A0A165ECN4_9BASI|nr:hypothetical protein CALCODRAFT_499620 [Calocera cornea HHB12733]